MPITVNYTILYGVAYSTLYTQTHTRSGTSSVSVPGDGVVPCFSMLGLKPDPNNPGQPAVPIAAFSQIPNFVEIDFFHLNYLQQPSVMAEMGALLTYRLVAALKLPVPPRLPRC